MMALNNLLTLINLGTFVIGYFCSGFPSIICTLIIICLFFAINISDKKSRRFDLSEVIFKCIKVL